MSDTASICLSCGLCCNGTILGYVQLEVGELARLKPILDFEQVGENSFILQPCPNYCNGCTIYDQRPKQCDLFKCKLLNDVEQKELDFNVALTSIADVKRVKSSIELKVTQLGIELQSPSFYFNMIELKKLLDKEQFAPEVLHQHQALGTDLHELDMLFTEKFGVTLF